MSRARFLTSGAKSMLRSLVLSEDTPVARSSEQITGVAGAAGRLVFFKMPHIASEGVCGPRGPRATSHFSASSPAQPAVLQLISWISD